MNYIISTPGKIFSKHRSDMLLCQQLVESKYEFKFTVFEIPYF
jgi:hypothetical protein